MGKRDRKSGRTGREWEEIVLLIRAEDIAYIRSYLCVYIYSRTANFCTYNKARRSIFYKQSLTLPPPKKKKKYWQVNVPREIPVMFL